MYTGHMLVDSNLTIFPEILMYAQTVCTRLSFTHKREPEFRLGSGSQSRLSQHNIL